MPKSHRPVSPKRLAANRANAARSTGPRSPEGKARSAQNARKHQFTGSTFAVVRLEDLQEIAHLRDDLVALYQPVNSQELFALERVALAQHAIEEFDRLKALREESPNKPIPEPDLEPRKTTYPEPQTNPNGRGGTRLQACRAGEQPQSKVEQTINLRNLSTSEGDGTKRRANGARRLLARLASHGVTTQGMPDRFASFSPPAPYTRWRL